MPSSGQQLTRVRRTRATTLVQPAPAVAGKVSAKPTETSKQGTPYTRVAATSTQVKDPANLARLLNSIQANAEQATIGARTTPIAQGGVEILNLVWTSGTAKLVVHNLGRRVHGYKIMRTRVGATAPINLQEAALPAGYDETVALNLVPSATGTGDLWVY